MKQGLNGTKDAKQILCEALRKSKLDLIAVTWINLNLMQLARPVTNHAVVNASKNLQTSYARLQIQHNCCSLLKKTNVSKLKSHQSLYKVLFSEKNCFKNGLKFSIIVLFTTTLYLKVRHSPAPPKVELQLCYNQKY